MWFYPIHMNSIVLDVVHLVLHQLFKLCGHRIIIFLIHVYCSSDSQPKNHYCGTSWDWQTHQLTTTKYTSHIDDTCSRDRPCIFLKLPAYFHWCYIWIFGLLCLFAMTKCSNCRDPWLSRQFLDAVWNMWP